MYAIDDTKDADSTNDHGKSAPTEKVVPAQTNVQNKPATTPEAVQAPVSQKRSFRKPTTGSEDL